MSKPIVTREARLRLLASLQRTAEAWGITANDLQKQPPSERLIVLDKLGRAYTRHATQLFKLAPPNTTLEDVFLMDPRSADAAHSWLTRTCAEYSPFYIQDAHTYALQCASDTKEVLTQITMVSVGELTEQPMDPSHVSEPSGAEVPTPHTTKQVEEPSIYRADLESEETSDEAPGP
jgi:hypothetical protein